MKLERRVQKMENKTKEVNLKIYTLKGRRRLAIAYKIGSKIKGYNIPLKC